MRLTMMRINRRSFDSNGPETRSDPSIRPAYVLAWGGKSALWYRMLSMGFPTSECGGISLLRAEQQGE